MIQAIRKAFDIIEFINRSPEAPRTIAEVAGNVGFPVATCGRILQTLVACGYIEQVAPRRGFVLGPMAYLLASRGPYRKDLVRKAEPAMTRLAKHVKETVVLVSLYRSRRFQLCEVDGGQIVHIRSDAVRHESVYQTATGRLLLAWLPPEQLELAVQRNGMPGKTWPGSNTKATMARRLEQIRRKGCVILSSKGHIAYMAYPVFEQERVVAAVGVYLPDHRFVGSHKKEILKGLNDTARTISKQLANNV